MMVRFAYLLYCLIMPLSLPGIERLRRWCVQRMTGQRVRNLYVFHNVFIEGFRHLKLGHDVSINHGCSLTCNGGLALGNHVAIGHGTSIITTEHGYADEAVPIKAQPIILRPVTIEDNVWIGARCTILAGVTIARGTVVAAGAVVTQDVTEADTIIGGVPARFIKHRLG